MPQPSLFIIDLEDLISFGAARRDNLKGVADLFGNQGAGNLRRHRNLTVVDIGFVFTNDLLGAFFVRIFIDDFHRCAKADHIA